MFQDLNLLAGLTAAENVSLPLAELQQVAARLQRSIEWSGTVTDGTLYLNVGDATLEAAVEVLAAGAEAGRVMTAGRRRRPRAVRPRPDRRSARPADRAEW